MASTREQVYQYLQELVLDDRGWTWSQWNDECRRIAIHLKYDYQLADLEIMYHNKLEGLAQRWGEIYKALKQGVSSVFIIGTHDDAIEDLRTLKIKATRIAKKWNTVKAEIRGRSLGFFVRTPIGTTYYIDLDGGNNGSDGLGTGTAWLTLEQYTTTTVRSAGDIALIRANTSQVNAGAQVDFDEDGNADNMLYIIGCDSVVNDPWSDASDVLPIYDFNVGAFRMYFYADLFWSMQRLDIKNSTHGNAMVHVLASKYAHFKDCVFQDYASPGDPAVYPGSGTVAVFDGCNFHDNDEINLRSDNANVYLRDCVLDGGGGNERGIQARIGGVVYVVDSDLGQNVAHGTSDFQLTSGGRIFCRNVNWNSGTPVALLPNNACRIIFEDDDEVYDDHVVEDINGTITKDTGVLRPAGGSSSIKMECKAACGIDAPLHLANHDFTAGYAPEWPYKYWMAAAQHTITIYIRGIGWTGFPTTAQLCVEASYLDHAANATRTKIKSNDVLADNITWTAFDVTFTPGQAGFVYLNVFLKHHEAACGVYVDAEPVIS